MIATLLETQAWETSKKIIRERIRKQVESLLKNMQNEVETELAKWALKTNILSPDERIVITMNIPGQFVGIRIITKNKTT